MSMERGYIYITIHLNPGGFFHETQLLRRQNEKESPGRSDQGRQVRQRHSHSLCVQGPYEGRPQSDRVCEEGRLGQVQKVI